MNTQIVDRLRTVPIALTVCVVYGALTGLVLLYFDNANLPGNDHPAGVVAYMLMNLLVFSLAWVVRRGSWMCGPVLKTGQFMVTVSSVGGSLAASAAKLLVYSGILTVPLLIAGFLGYLMRRADSNRRKIWIVAWLTSLLVFEVLFWQIVRVDRCLDSGGRWNYELSICER